MARDNNDTTNGTIIENNVIENVGDFLQFNATVFTTETLVLENNNFSSFELNTPYFWINEELEKLIATTENPDEANFSLIAEEFFAQANIGQFEPATVKSLIGRVVLALKATAAMPSSFDIR